MRIAGRLRAVRRGAFPFTARLAFYEGLFGPDHFEVAATLNNLGLARVAQGDVAERRELLTRSLEIERTLFAATIARYARPRQISPLWAYPDPMMPRLRSVAETALDVDDLERARTFYTTIFRLQVLLGDSRFCALAVSTENVLLLFQRAGSDGPIRVPGGIIPPHGSRGTAHFAFGIAREDVEWWRQHLTHHGVAIYSEVQWPLGGVSLYFHDPDGHVGELATPGVWDFSNVT